MDIPREIAKAYQAFAAGRNAEAADCARRVLEFAPGDPAALTLIGRLALSSGDAEFACQTFRLVLNSHPQVSALHVDLALALRELGGHLEAAEAARRAVTLDESNTAAWVALGEIRLSLNEKQEAADAFHRALQLEGDNVAAYRGLCLASEVNADSVIVRRMEALLNSSKLRPRELAGLHYALAQIHRRAGERQRFIQHLFAANATQRAASPGGRAEYAAIFDRLESIFTREAFLKAARADPAEPIPIFILGMPRSGTTLVQQLLAAHPDVASGGELDYVRRPLGRAVERLVGQPFPQGFETVPAPELNSLARAYARRLSLVDAQSPYVTDKTPGNFHVLGLLRMLAPHGRIIHVARDPMDTCFSILQYQFDDRSPHTCDPALLAYAYARYLRLMCRWRELFGGEFITVEYERLVESPAAEGHRLFEYCGLEWNDSYLEFHRRGGAVRTFSAPQVRRPIYRSSICAWREFAVELDPLKQALESELRHLPDAAAQPRP